MHVSSIQRLKRVEMPTCCTKKLGSQLQAAVRCRIEDFTNSVNITVYVLCRSAKHCTTCLIQHSMHNVSACLAMLLCCHC